MKKIMFLLAMLRLGTLYWAGSAREDARPLDNATSVMHEIMGMPKGSQKKCWSLKVCGRHTAHGEGSLFRS